MNADTPQTPREEIEARVTALLLGELSAEEAAEVRAQMAADDGLVDLYLRLSQAVELVRAASALPEPAASPIAPRLSDERRARLLAHFQSGGPAPIVIQPRWDWTGLIPIGLAASLIALIGWSVFLNSVALNVRTPAPDFVADGGGLVSSEVVSRGYIGTPAPLVSLAAPASEAPALDSPATPAFSGNLGHATAAAQPAPLAINGGMLVLTSPSAARAADPQPPMLTKNLESSGGFADASSLRPADEIAAIATDRKPVGASLEGANSYAGRTTSVGGTVALGGQAKSLGWFGATGQIAAASPSKKPENSKPNEAARGEQPDASKTIAPHPRADVAEVKKDFADAENSYQAGRFDLALKRTEQILNLDPNNIAARKFQEKVGKAVDDYGTTAENEMRSRATRGLDVAWASPIRHQPTSEVAEKTKSGVRSKDLGTVITKEYQARPELFSRGPAPLPADAIQGVSGVAKRGAAKDWLTSNGITFGPQASAIYIASSNKLIVRNTPEQLDLVEAIVAAGESAEVPPAKAAEEDAAAQKKQSAALEPQPEMETRAKAFSTFSLNVSDVAFKLAAASLEQGKMPDVATVRSEEFINAFDYRDPEPAAGAPLAFAAERARYPFAQNRDLLRLSVKTAAAGRQPGRALNLVLLLDNSGSMERADRVSILREALRVLAAQLRPEDQFSVVTFARTPRLWADGVAGGQAGAVLARVGEITPQGGTDLAAALDLGYATALRHYRVGSINRVVLLTDGAANLGDVNPAALQQKVEAHRRQGVALDCFGIGWEGLNDDLLEQLSRHGDGRYGFINTPEEAATGFAAQLAGALRVAASEVKVQVEFNPRRVTAYRQIGYAQHQLTQEQFRDNTVDAAEIGAAESGNALYVCEVNPRGEGDLATVRVRFKVPGTDDTREHEWTVPFAPNAPPLEQASPALRLAGTASAFAEWLVASPFAAEVTPDRLLALLNGVPALYGADPRPQKLEWMIRQAKSVSGK